MFLKRLKLNSYRNYETLDFEFSKNKTLFVGKNAQGKTNLLEAVYYLSCLTSNRIKKDKELIKFDSEFCNPVDQFSLIFIHRLFVRNPFFGS